MSELATGFKFMTGLLSNGLAKQILKSSSEICVRCGQRPIDMALNDYVGVKTERCMRCKLLTGMLHILIGIVVRSLHASKSELSNILGMSFWRRSIVSVVKGLAYFGPSKPFVTGSPLLVVWNYTNQCNLKCLHCYQNAGSQLGNELSTAEALKVVDQLGETDVSTISFSGGEPLMRRDFFEVAKRAHDYGMYVSVATNGTLITHEVAEKLAKVVDYVEVSIDGNSAKTHDDFRGIHGSWDRAVKGLKECVAQGLYTAVSSTATKRNFSEIPRIINFAEEVGAKCFICFNFIPVGRAKETPSLDLSPQEREQLLVTLYERLVKNTVNQSINIFTTAPQFARVGLQHAADAEQKIVPATHYGNVPGVTKEIAGFIGGCGAGRVYCAISPEGYVMPCVFMPIIVGDLRKQSFKDIWLNSNVLNDLRDRGKLKGRCGECSYKFICGGCRARAYGYHADYLMPDPGCIRELEYGNKQSAK